MCQAKHIHEMGSKRPFRLKVEQFFVTTLIKLKIPLFMRKIRKYKAFIMSYLEERKNKEDSKDSISSPSQFLKPGDMVRVRSKEQIMQTLDENKRLGGCAFMEEMWQYCGGEYKVAKKLEYFFDEASFKMLKARDLILLEGLHCSGNVPIFQHRCDRYCLLFWKEAWLEKVEPGDKI